jgi:transcriptional regulator with XRE-family HTH domain
MKDHVNGHRDYGLSGATVATKATRDPEVWNSELDAIVREGYSRGWSGARDAINRIQRLRPKWYSHVVWDRAIQLGFQKRYVRERPPWSDADDAALMDCAQEQSAKTIASWLHRTEGAVLWRFKVLGESARVRDNYSQHELARDLRVSPRTIRRWETAGVLKRRDGRITHESLKQLFRKRGSEINYDALDKEMQQWLIDSVGFAPVESCLARDQRIRKHLQRVGVCPRCGRKTRGNAHGRHIKACKGLGQEGRASTV